MDTVLRDHDTRLVYHALSALVTYTRHPLPLSFKGTFHCVVMVVVIFVHLLSASSSKAPSLILPSLPIV